MIEIEYPWDEIFEHLNIFKMGKTIYIDKKEYRLIGMKIQVRNGANMFLKLTYSCGEEMKGIFGMEMYEEDFTGVPE